MFSIIVEGSQHLGQVAYRVDSSGGWNIDLLDQYAPTADVWQTTAGVSTPRMFLPSSSTHEEDACIQWLSGAFDVASDRFHPVMVSMRG
jgi:hypothetical protein